MGSMAAGALCAELSGWKINIRLFNLRLHELHENDLTM
jgi:hypothetical protein